MAQAATRVALVCALASLLGVVSALLVWRTLAPTEPALPQVPFDGFLSAVHQGQVDEVHIEGSVYTFRSHDAAHRAAETKRTMGPVADIALIRGLRPSSTDGIPPKVYFER
jgi:hypothetical protein